ncbi:MAG: hypothetical protein CSA39_01220 [Flavobacteriales bacterium]|nr:MAG: hypothetical protein CR989_00705 [Flavobacteriales bacterium]PIE49732.1 MAG: hypothetical protein CSA39_01220 [Flavobacteriales bacterium]
MKTVQQAVREIINKTPFIEEALYDKLINVSSLARMVKPEVETILRKEIKDGAIMMALNRLSPSNTLKIRRNIKKITFSSGDFITRSNLCDYTFKNTATLVPGITELITEIGADSDSFFTVSQGVFETNIVISKKIKDKVERIFKKEEILWSEDQLASITIKLPRDNVEQPGIYYFILKQMAWANITVIEIISTTHEITLVVREKEIKNAFSILIDLKTN